MATTRRHHERQIEGATNEWLTPPEIVRALGPFDLDPSSPVDRPWDTAARHYTRIDDGLSLPWSGRVWLNPPYGPQASRWVRRLAEHGNGIALLFARTDTRMYAESIWDHATGILFVRGRINFRRIDGSKSHGSGAPSALIAYGLNNYIALEASGIAGKLIQLNG